MNVLTEQQRAVLEALREQSPTPTAILRDVHAPWPQPSRGRTYRIGEPVGAVLRRLERRGLVTGERGSTDLLNMLPGDEVVDLYPGTGVMGRVAARRGDQLDLLQDAAGRGDQLDLGVGTTTADGERAAA